MIAVAVMLIGLKTGCGTTPTAEPGFQLHIGPEAFASDPGGRLRVTNHSGSELAIFVGRVERGNFIGAIGTGADGRPQSRTFDLNRITGLPQRGTFILRATTFTELNRRGLAGITEEQVIYSGLVWWDNLTDNIEHDIFRGIDAGQNTFIHVSNNSRYVLELRLGESTGERVAVLGPRQQFRRIWVQPDPLGLPLTLFPRYIYMDPRTGTLNAFSDDINFRGRSFEPETAGQHLAVINFDGPAAGGGPRFNVAFIEVQNNINSLIMFQNVPGNLIRNDRGTFGTPPGRTDSFQLDTGEFGRRYPAAEIRTDFGDFPILDLRERDLMPGNRYQLVIEDVSGIRTRLVPLGLRDVSADIHVDLFAEF